MGVLLGNKAHGTNVFACCLVAAVVSSGSTLGRQFTSGLLPVINFVVAFIACKTEEHTEG